MTRLLNVLIDIAALLIVTAQGLWYLLKQAVLMAIGAAIIAPFAWAMFELGCQIGRLL